MIMLPSLTSHAMTAAIFLPFHTCDVGPWLKVCHERDGMSLIVVIYDRYRTRLCMKIMFFILVSYNHNTISTLLRWYLYILGLHYIDWRKTFSVYT